MNDPAFEYYVWKETRQIKKLLQKMNDDTSFEIHRQQETKDFILQLRHLIFEKDTEIERLKETTTLLQRECAKRGIRIADLERLIIRAADALAHESWVSEEQCGLPSQFEELITELRKAAE